MQSQQARKTLFLLILVAAGVFYAAKFVKEKPVVPEAKPVVQEEAPVRYVALKERTPFFYSEETSAPVGYFTANSEVEILEVADNRGWVKVHHNGLTGWINISALDIDSAKKKRLVVQ